MGTSVNTPRSAYIYKVAKSLGFCFRTKKPKPKPFAWCLTGNPTDFRTALIISGTPTQNNQQKHQKINEKTNFPNILSRRLSSISKRSTNNLIYF
jgi:hypothetical protein